MMSINYDVLISDWNGTLIASRDEKGIMQSIAMDYAVASLPLRLTHLIRLFKVQRKLNELYREGRRDDEFDYVIEMFRVFNAHIVNGLPVDFVNRSIERNAAKKKTLENIDISLLRIIDRCHREGKQTGILSAGFEENIRASLRNAGYDCSFDFYEANLLKHENGKAIGFDLSIYRKKYQFLQDLLKRRNIDERHVVYIGDSEDDAECFEFVGFPVVSFMAPAEIKNLYARKYKAFVPETEQDLSVYLGLKSGRY
jgi:phosphoserine phosphatase